MPYVAKACKWRGVATTLKGFLYHPHKCFTDDFNLITAYLTVSGMQGSDLFFLLTIEEKHYAFLFLSDRIFLSDSTK
jgi:hypothetical protein